MDTIDLLGSATRDEALQTARSRLRAVCSALSLFQSGSEDVFLETAAALNGLVDRAHRLVALSTSVVDRASGEQGRDPTEALGGEVACSAAWLSASGASAAANARRLRETLTAIDALGSAGGELRRIVKRLRALGVCTRIESARSGSQGAEFDTVAEDVGRLGELIETRFGEIRSSAAFLRGITEEARVRADDFLGRQRGWSSQALEQAQSSLASLRSFSSAASGVAAEGASVSVQLAESVEQVLMSLQAHDITRQMTEHVLEELEGFEADVSRSTVGDCLPETPEVWLAEAAELSRLEASQLRNAREDLESALRQIADHLRGMAVGVGALAEKMRRVAGKRGEGSLLETVERGIRQAAQGLQEVSAHETHAAEAMGRVAQTVEEVAGYVLAIEAIGEDIELIALNAQVKAARTGEGARGLWVLAGDIQKLSSEVGGHTTLVSQLLRGIAEHAKDLRAGGEGRGGQRGAETVLAGLQEMVSTLREFHVELGAGIEELLAGSEALTQEVDHVGRRISEQIVDAAALSTLERELSEVAATAAEEAGSAGGIGTSERVRAAVSRYTMESERATHRAVVAGPLRGTGFAPPPGELGNNVELF